MDVDDRKAAAIAAARRRIDSALRALGDESNPGFWPTIQGDVSLPLEVLIIVARRCLKEGHTEETRRVADILINRTYSMIEGVARRALPARPKEEREQAVQDTYVKMWEFISQDKPFWEENCTWALCQACRSACLPYRSKTHRLLDGPSVDLDAIGEDDDAGPGKKPASDAEMDTTAAAPAAILVARPETATRSPVERAVLAREDASRGRAVYDEVLTRLSDDQVAVLRLLVEEGLSQVESAARLGCTPKTIYNRLQHIRTVMTTYLAERESNE